MESSPELDSYLRAVTEILDAPSSVPDAVGRIAEANRTILGNGFKLPERYRGVRDGVPYTRNLVHADPQRRFTVIAIVWGGFQETRVHDHLNWCVVKVLEGRCHAVDYERLDDESRPGHAELAIRETTIAEPGTVVSLLPPPRTNIHKMANATRGLAVSLHTYGDPGTRARVFDPLTGKVEIVELEFHNL